MSAIRCPKRRCHCLLRIEVLRDGSTEAVCDWCERTARGLCRDCPRKVYGRIGWAVRCADCARRRRLDLCHTFRDDDDVRRHIAARDRTRYRTDEAYAERKRARRRDWSARNPEKRKAAARRLLLSEGPARERQLATNRRHNADPVRKARKRAAALAAYYIAHPTRPDPHCAGCGYRVTWGGIGIPAKWCDGCCSPAELRRRQKAGTAVTAIVEDVA